MPSFKVSLKLFYERSINHYDEDEEKKYESVPDLKKEDFDDFILNNDIHSAFIEDFGDAYGIISEISYTVSHHILSFKLTINEDTMFIELKENIEEMIKDIKENFLDNSLEDSLYEGTDAMYSIKHAKEYYPNETKFENEENEDESLLEVGLIDYRNEKTIKVVHIKDE
jgi:hypothetical protein